MQNYQQVKDTLKKQPKTWLITGVAGFIGSNLLEALLKLDQRVVGFDNFSTGYQRNLDMALSELSPQQQKNFKFLKADIRDLKSCHELCVGVDYVLHHAALGSVPHSIDDPLLANDCNITGFLNMLVAARDAKVKNFVYAASSATYGDEPTLPKKEELIGKPLSPYALTKYVNELYAAVFADAYGFKSIGLRYFNIFGKRQDPKGAYAAVIPCWFSALLKNETVYINGDGENTRDFCYVDNVIQANILAACTENNNAFNTVYNIALGRSTNLNELFEMIKKEVVAYNQKAQTAQAVHREYRSGDIRHSVADISKAQNALGYMAEYSVEDGLALAAKWYAENL
ncbi:SDR family oxidoreductase [Desulfovibrio litoralis]|uniref:UDP-N-acetylglucosamine 4-epimerase n=1 Tax=Desulfovibrio litoralis DSM 11393 TaxID=1121455 RepID=A0A1M7S6Z4_9BACT|nr:SDR family oxidoreductase [Desulfovibrio litoralis]SHN54193.1 UDP-N-acetylglucosamine 4-epimerase [Desulfovibrio litoralis DSM 11393]